MIYCFCCNFYEEEGNHEFYESAVAMMRGANDHAFSRKEDFDVFLFRLKRKLEKEKPEGHSAIVEVFYERDMRKGQIYIWGKEGGSIACLHFRPVKSVLEYDMGTGRFINVKEK